MTRRERLAAALDKPAALWLTVALATLLTAPALASGWLMDDLAQRAALADDAPSYLARSPLELYSFFYSDEAWRRTALDEGLLPWYADSELHIELWRPLSSLTLYVDHLLWPRSAVLAHLHGVVWYALLILVVGLLYRRLMPWPRVAALATILFAVDEAHGFPVAWVANRHAVVSMVFATLALLAHVRWRREGWSAGAVLAPLAFGLGLLSSETALSVSAYFFAFAVFLDPAPARGRALSLVPCALIAVVWKVIYGALGFGTSGSAVMVDPVHEPLRYLAHVPLRLPLLIQGQLTPLMPDFAMVLTGTAATVLAVVTAVVIAALVLALWRLVRRDKLAAFWVTGLVVATLPACATFVSDRLLFPTGIGGMGLVAQVIMRRSDADLDGYWARRSLRILAGLFIAFHLVLAPLLLPLRSLQPKAMSVSLDEAFKSLDQVGDQEALAGETLFVVIAPQFTYTSYAVLGRQSLGLPAPDRVIALAHGVGATTVTRVDDHTLSIASEDGFVTSPLDGLLRDPERPFAPGLDVELSDLSIEVERVTDNGYPAELRCTFSGEMNEPGRLFVTWSEQGFVPFALPAVGETATIDAVDPAALASYHYEPQH